MNSRNPFVRTAKQGTLLRLVNISRRYHAAVLTERIKRQFRLRLQVYPEGEPLFSKFITLTRFHEHLASAIAAIRHYHEFPELGFPEVDLTVLNSLLTDPVVIQYV